MFNVDVVGSPMGLRFDSLFQPCPQVLVRVAFHSSTVKGTLWNTGWLYLGYSMLAKDARMLRKECSTLPKVQYLFTVLHLESSSSQPIW